MTKKEQEILSEIVNSEINVAEANIKELNYQIKHIDGYLSREKKDLIWCEYLIRKSEYLPKLAYIEAKLIHLKNISKSIRTESSAFLSIDECKEEAKLFAENSLKISNKLLSEDYKNGYVEGVEHYIISKTKQL
jgi:hypothetical protein